MCARTDVMIGCRECDVVLYIGNLWKVPRTEVGAALHMLGALRWSYNAQKLFCIIPRNFGVWFFGKIQHPGARLQLLTSAWWFEMIWSRLARKWHIKVGIEPNATIGQLVKKCMPIGCGTTNISDTKRHTHNRLLANLMPTRTHRIENKIIIKNSEGERSDTIMSVAA